MNCNLVVTKLSAGTEIREDKRAVTASNLTCIARGMPRISVRFASNQLAHLVTKRRTSTIKPRPGEMLQIETDQQGSQSQPTDSHSPDPARSSYSIMQETINEKNTTFAQAGGKHIRNDTTRRSEWRRSRKIREMVEESTGLDYQRSAGLAH
jgi:hypothetical protein